MDSDDYIPENAIEILVNEAKDCQMVIGRTITSDEKISVTSQHEKNFIRKIKMIL